MFKLLFFFFLVICKMSICKIYILKFVVSLALSFVCIIFNLLIFFSPTIIMVSLFSSASLTHFHYKTSKPCQLELKKNYLRGPQDLEH